MSRHVLSQGRLRGLSRVKGDFDARFLGLDLEQMTPVSSNPDIVFNHVKITTYSGIHSVLIGQAESVISQTMSMCLRYAMNIHADLTGQLFVQSPIMNKKMVY